MNQTPSYVLKGERKLKKLLASKDAVIQYGSVESYECTPQEGMYSYKKEMITSVTVDGVRHETKYYKSPYGGFEYI